MGFVTKSVFWLGLVYSSMPFDERIAPATLRSIGPAALSGSLAACDHGMSEDCRNAIKKLRLAAEIVAASGDLLHKSLTKPDLTTPPAARDRVSPPDGGVVRPVESH